MNTGFDAYLARQVEEHELNCERLEYRREVLTDEAYEREQLQSILMDAFNSDAVDDLIAATLDWYGGKDDAKARKAISDAVAALTDKAVDEYVADRLRAEGWAV